MHLDVTVLAMELQLLLELGAHLCLSKLNLLLNVLVCLDLKLGVDLPGEPFAFLLNPERLVVLKLFVIRASV